MRIGVYAGFDQHPLASRSGSILLYFCGSNDDDAQASLSGLPMIISSKACRHSQPGISFLGMDNLGATAKRLWGTAPYWRYSLLAAGLFSILFGVHLADEPSTAGSSGPSRYTPAMSSLPVAPSDPASDARLADYQSAHDEALKVPRFGERCEKMLAALEMLTPDDARRGRNPRTSPPTLFRALADGEGCRTSLTASDKHFEVLSGAAAAAQAARSSATVSAAVRALHGLDGFDQSRTRFGDMGPTLAAVQTLEKDEAASVSRLADITNRVATYRQDPAAPNALAVKEALDRLTPSDRERLANQQPSILQAAIETSTAVGDSKARLARIPNLLANAGPGSTPAARRALVDAVTALIPFDEAMATLEEKKAVAEAQRIARADLWDLARQRLQDLDRQSSPENYNRVAGLGPALDKLSAAAAPTADEQPVLDRVHAAADKLARSNDHLAALVAAAAAWKKSGLNAAPEIGPAVASIDDQLDRPRFHQAEIDAWKTLQGAQAVIHGPDIGLNPKTKGRITIAVLPAGNDDFDADVARRLGRELGGFGFQIVADRQVAALWASTAIRRRPPPQQDWSDLQAQSTAEADVSAIFAWQYGKTLLLSCDKVGHSRGKDDRGLSALAVLDAVGQLAACLNDYTAAQPSP